MASDALTLPVPEAHPCFAHHFPGAPLVPGALLLTWVVEAVERAHPAWRVCGIRQFKFIRPVLPGDVLHLRLDIEAAAQAASARCAVVVEVAGQGVARGQLEVERVG